MFTLTPNAAEQIARAAQASGAVDMPLRVAARIETDGSMQYGMGFDDVREEDMNLRLEGIDVVISSPHQALLEHITLDFVELEPGQFHFIFVPGEAASEPAPLAGGCGSGGCSRCGGPSA